APVSDKNVMSLVLAENDKLYWWEGVEGKVEETNYSRNGLRKLLIERNKNNQKLMVLIKPSDKSKYENLVDVLDEITITSTSRYTIVDFTGEDQNRLNELTQIN
ncbi:MAG TPA: biopolymer transporter ExbD, partial [Chryseosolibacter sp.]